MDGRKNNSVFKDLDRTFFVSDLHLGHPLVSRKRGFSTTDAHDEYIIGAIRRVTPHGANLIVMGDITVRREDYALEVIDQLKHELELSSLILLPGNHDMVHPMCGLDQNLRWSAPFNAVFDYITLQLETYVPQVGHVLLSHLPCNEAENRYTKPHLVRFAPKMNGYLVNVHGHTHRETLIDHNFVNLSLEATGLAPVSLRDVHYMTAMDRKTERQQQKTYQLRELSLPSRAS